MTNRYTGLLVPETGNAPKTLAESILQVKDLSVVFSQSWLLNKRDDAQNTSEQAFQLLDHIQNELLRHRDERKNLIDSSLKVALNAIVGQLLDPANSNDKEFFRGLAIGEGLMPRDASDTLTLETALNKLKHRSTSSVNFTVSNSGTHVLYVFTNAGSGHKDTISSFDIRVFCDACKVAADAIDTLPIIPPTI